MKRGEKVSANFLTLGGKFLARQKERKDADRNRKRLEEAKLVSKEFGVQRIANAEIKKLVSRLTYEADSYIAASLENPDAFYDPLVLDALDTAQAALNVWKKNENDVVALKYLETDRTGGIVIAKDNVPGINVETRERTLGILNESLRVFVMHNSIRTAADPEAALAALAGSDFVTGIGEKDQ